MDQLWNKNCFFKIKLKTFKIKILNWLLNAGPNAGEPVKAPNLPAWRPLGEGL